MLLDQRGSEMKIDVEYVKKDMKRLENQFGRDFIKSVSTDFIKKMNLSKSEQDRVLRELGYIDDTEDTEDKTLQTL